MSIAYPRMAEHHYVWSHYFGKVNIIFKLIRFRTERIKFPISDRLDHDKVLKILLEHGADINFTNENGQTELHMAADRGSIEVLEALAENGADVNFKDKNGQTPVHSAAASGNSFIID